MSSCVESGKEGHVSVLCWPRALNDGQRVDEGATDGISSMVNWEAEDWCLVHRCISKVVVFILQTSLAA